MAVNLNTASNLGTKRRRRKNRRPQMGELKARAVGLRRQGRAPASDTRARSFKPPRPTSPSARKAAGRITIDPIERRPTPLPTAAPKPTTASSTATGTRPTKPPVPAGQPPAYGARRKPTLPPGLAKRTAGSSMATPKAFAPKPPRRPKRAKGY